MGERHVGKSKVNAGAGGLYISVRPCKWTGEGADEPALDDHGLTGLVRLVDHDSGVWDGALECLDVLPERVVPVNRSQPWVDGLKIVGEH